MSHPKGITGYQHGSTFVPLDEVEAKARGTKAKAQTSGSSEPNAIPAGWPNDQVRALLSENGIDWFEQLPREESALVELKGIGKATASLILKQLEQEGR